MRIEYSHYVGVNTDGTFENDPEHLQGSVHPDARIDTSGGHHAQTPTNIEDGLWMYVSTGRLTDGQMHIITLKFDDESEMREFERKGIAILG